MPKVCKLSCLLLLAVPLLTMGQEKKAEPLPSDPSADPMLLAAGFLQQHPDLLYRKHGMDALKDKKAAKALDYFRRAGYYADKPSQGMVAELLWSGAEGVPQDRAAAYAWMDLAAERDYRLLAIQREKYWQAMNATERERALEIGKDLYARFGDDTAKRRLENALRWETKKAVGSRLGGFAGASVKIGNADADGNFDATLDGSKFYDPRFWDADKYWEYTDQLWKNLRSGRAIVGDLQQITDAQLKQAEAGRKMEESQPVTAPADKPH